MPRPWNTCPFSSTSADVSAPSSAETRRRRARRRCFCARVRVIAAEIGKSLIEHVRAGRLEHAPGPLGPDSFADCVLAVVALEDEGDAAEAAEFASARGIPVNAVDRPELRSCIVPAIVDRAPVVVAVSTARRQRRREPDTAPVSRLNGIRRPKARVIATAAVPGRGPVPPRSRSAPGSRNRLEIHRRHSFSIMCQ
ncbi:MAG TPA: NAD(P)-dependent oxidoreductase [Gammaproteobacteria bacterium]|nr:NAD(P)-dependent oxidoreductase [Gammaproteobacteria bacterium]